MELIPAIDLLGGMARRLVRGDYRQPIEAQADPLTLAGRFLAGGVSRLHVVDLDGARDGRPTNLSVLDAICRLARQAPGATPVAVQAGGGLRTLESVEATLAAGAQRVMLGSAAVREPGFVAECAASWPGRVGASLDVRDGRPAVDGWQATIAADPLDLADRLLEAGAAFLVVTDTARDGTGQGPALEMMERLRRRLPRASLLCAGGIASTADLRALAELGIDGAVVGRALLEGTLDLDEALAACAVEVAA